MTRARRAPDRGDEDGSRRAVLVTASIPCEEFALSATLSRVPAASFRGETTIEGGASFLPLLRARARRQDELDAALRDDPTTESVTRLADRGDARLYRVRWANDVQFPVDLLTSDGATILDVGVNAEAWTVRMLFPSRRALGSTVGRCEEYGLPIELRKLGHVGDEGSGQYDLTATQYESLQLAAERGYYQIPRQSKLDDLADEAGVSHQAYSERLRRATGSLVEQTLLDTAAPTREGF
jgi:hypothetical protein